jgi:hypothetical protein
MRARRPACSSASVVRVAARLVSITSLRRPAGPPRRWGVVVGLLVLWVALARRAAAGEPGSAVARSYVFAALLLAGTWALAPPGLRPRELVGAPPTDRREWAWVGLAVLLAAFSLTSVVGATSSGRSSGGALRHGVTRGWRAPPDTATCRSSRAGR